MTAPGSDRFRSGEYLELEMIDPDPAVESQILLHQDELLNLTPARAWSPERSFKWLSSAPGRHRFLFERRRGADILASAALDVQIVDLQALEPSPVRSDVANGMTLWSPSLWEKGHLSVCYEDHCHKVLAEWAQKGAVVYDLGANLGVHAVALGRWIGAAGRLFCFEANPVCVYFLRANLRQNGIENATIVPAAVGNSERTMPFMVDFGNSFTGTAAASPLYASKAGQRILVECVRLDDLIARGVVPPADLIKIDIEGSELEALEGMTALLRKQAPTFVIEVHGQLIGVELLRLLDGLGYRHRILGDASDWRTGSELPIWNLQPVFQIVSAHPRRLESNSSYSGR